jgi:fructose-bisphosphate aldolase, class I
MIQYNRSSSMSLGKKVRLGRLFSHPSGRLCSVAIDHFSGYNIGLPPGLRHMRETLAAVTAGQPDAVTMHKGTAAALWEPYAGKIPLIIQASWVRPDDTARETLVTIEEAVRLGADALAVVVYTRQDTEGAYLRNLAQYVRESARLELPVICHVYPRNAEKEIIYTPEDIAWSVHSIVETGADVVKSPYCGDLQAHTQIAQDCPVPLVAAGGPKTNTLEEAFQLMEDVVTSGVMGATIGRNIWGNPDITGMLRAFKAVIHDEAAPHEALKLVAV